MANPNLTQEHTAGVSSNTEYKILLVPVVMERILYQHLRQHLGCEIYNTTSPDDLTVQGPRRLIQKADGLFLDYGSGSREPPLSVEGIWKNRFWKIAHQPIVGPA